MLLFTDLPPQLRSRRYTRPDASVDCGDEVSALLALLSFLLPYPPLLLPPPMPLAMQLACVRRWTSPNCHPKKN